MSSDTSLYSTVDEKVNPLRPYYTPGLHRQHNYTSLPSNDTTPGTIPTIFDTADTPDPLLQNNASHTISHALMRYIVTMLSSPFEVGTTLQQVQYTPHPDVEVFTEYIQSNKEQQQPASSTSSLRYLSSDDEDDYDFYTSTKLKTSTSTPTKVLYRTDLKCSYSVYDAHHRPRYQMAPMQGGLLDILNQIVKHPSEGWQSLLKGQRVGWIYDILRSFLQYTIEHHLNDIFGLYDDTIPLMHLDSVTGNLTTMLTSHVAVGLILSPLEIMRTRMIVQSSGPVDGPYRSVFKAWRSLLQDEDGLQSIYFSAMNVCPTLLYHSLTPLLHYTAPILIDRTCHISAADHPILYGAATFGLSVFALLLTMPLETIRKRLHCQIGAFRRRQHHHLKTTTTTTTTATTTSSSPSSSSSSIPSNACAFQTTVPLRPVYYHGILDALYKIMKEEGAGVSPTMTAPLPSMERSVTNAAHATYYSSEDDDAAVDKQHINVSRRKKVSSAWGVRGLYKGFGIQLIANTIMFILNTVNGLEDDLGGLL
ncbi:unnamed protein product [Absidia cylindrospora]